MPFHDGDIVEITHALPDMQNWLGLRARVRQAGPTNTNLIPEQVRPDGYGRYPFFWPTSDLRLAALVEDEPAPVETVNGFAVGDRVRTVDFGFCLLDSGEVGTVTRVNDQDYGGGQNMAVNFDNIPHGGYYNNGEYIVEGELFDSFEKIDGATSRPFVIGDRVRIVRAEYAQEAIGRTGSIVAIPHTPAVLNRTPHPWEVTVDDGGGTYHVAEVELIEPIEPRPFVVGDRIVLKTAREYPRNDYPPGGLTFGTVYTVSRLWTGYGDDYLGLEETGGSGGFYPARFKLASATPTPEPTRPRPRFRVGDHVRIVQASEAAQAIGRWGMVIRVHDEPILIGGVPHPYDVQLDGVRSGRRGSTWHAAEVASRRR